MSLIMKSCCLAVAVVMGFVPPISADENERPVYLSFDQRKPALAAADLEALSAHTIRLLHMETGADAVIWTSAADQVITVVSTWQPLDVFSYLKPELIKLLSERFPASLYEDVFAEASLNFASDDMMTDSLKRETKEEQANLINEILQVDSFLKAYQRIHRFLKDAQNLFPQETRTTKKEFRAQMRLLLEVIHSAYRPSLKKEISNDEVLNDGFIANLFNAQKKFFENLTDLNKLGGLYSSVQANAETLKVVESIRRERNAQDSRTFKLSPKVKSLKSELDEFLAGYDHFIARIQEERNEWIERLPTIRNNIASGNIGQSLPASSELMAMREAATRIQKAIATAQDFSLRTYNFLGGQKGRAGPLFLKRHVKRLRNAQKLQRELIQFAIQEQDLQTAKILLERRPLSRIHWSMYYAEMLASAQRTCNKKLVSLIQAYAPNGNSNK